VLQLCFQFTRFKFFDIESDKCSLFSVLCMRIEISNLKTSFSVKGFNLWNNVIEEAVL